MDGASCAQLLEELCGRMCNEKLRVVAWFLRSIASWLNLVLRWIESVVPGIIIYTVFGGGGVVRLMDLCAASLRA